MAERPDELMHRLIEWTGSQWQSEQLAALILDAEGYTGIDPTHPYGGPDGRNDAIAVRNGERWVMACWFPEGKKSKSELRTKVKGDYEGVGMNDAVGLAFVTNQRISASGRTELAEMVGGPLDVFHQVRVVHILERDSMKWVRQKYVHMGPSLEEQSIIDRSVTLEDQLVTVVEQLRREPFQGVPPMDWVRQVGFIVERATETRGTDLRVLDPPLRLHLDSVRRGWTDLLATLNRQLFEPLYADTPDQSQRIRATHAVRQHRLRADISAHALAARDRIQELTRDPWRIGRDDTDVPAVQAWDDGEPPSMGWPE